MCSLSSIDIRNSKGVGLVLIAALSGGGGSLAANKLWGPGGNWETLVVNQAVLQEQMIEQKKSSDKLTKVLETGFKSIASSLTAASTTTQELTFNYQHLLERQVDQERRLRAVELLITQLTP